MLININKREKEILNDLINQQKDFLEEENVEESDTKAIKELEKLQIKLNTTRPKIVIEVMGGVAECTKCPTGIEVVIIDYDNVNGYIKQY